MQSLAAIADPTRRRIVELLAVRERTAGQLVDEFDMSAPAISQHLKVLKEAGLVSDRQEGARRIYYIDPHGLGELRRWLDGFWDEALLAFKAEVETKNSDAPR